MTYFLKIIAPLSSCGDRQDAYADCMCRPIGHGLCTDYLNNVCCNNDLLRNLKHSFTLSQHARRTEPGDRCVAWLTARNTAAQCLHCRLHSRFADSLWLTTWKEWEKLTQMPQWLKLMCL